MRHASMAEMCMGLLSFYVDLHEVIQYMQQTMLCTPLGPQPYCCLPESYSKLKRDVGVNCCKLRAAAGSLQRCSS